MSRPLSLALAQLAPQKGDYPANLRRLRALFAQLDAVEPRPRVLQLPETALTGYFLEGGVREMALTAGTLARDLDDAYRAAAPGRPPLDVVVGFYELWRHTLYNSAMYVRLGDGDAGAGVGGRVLHVHRKNFLPTYGMFDEERFVERGTELRAFDTPWGRAGLLVCEDAWHSLPGTVLALDGAELIFVCSAAPGRGMLPTPGSPPGPANVARWTRLVRDIAEEHGVFVSLANLAGSEGGKMFTGSSMLAGPAGDLRLCGPPWEEALLTACVELRDVTRTRAELPLLADLRVALPHLRRGLDAVTAGATGDQRPRAQFDAAEEPPADDAVLVHPTPGAADEGGLPVVRGGDAARGAPASLEIDAAVVEAWLVHFLRAEMRQRGFAKAIVGVSGGVDSAVTAFLAARALGPENVVGVRMPYRTSSPASLEHGQAVLDALGIEARTVDISAAVDGYLAQEPEADARRRGNVMARLRMITLFDLGERYRAVPLGTGNKTERLFGYFTWHADDSPPINPLGDLYKTQVWALARHLGVPAPIVDKPPSADLVQGQTDEGDFGISYARADELLNWLLNGYSPAELAARGFDPREVELVRRRVEGTHWKRRLPTVALLSPTAIGESYLRPVDY
ncbi:MAG TPA: NAD+ synthase [Gemmatimonadaceae bacterium]